MARLLVKSAGVGLSTLELRLGVNHVGRSAENDFTLNHSTISTRHCELILSADGVVLHDLNSTNGSYVNGEPVEEVWLENGQSVRLGDVELTVESTDSTIAIPKLEQEKPAAPPVMLPDGAFLCPRHPENRATFRCTTCLAIMCSSCVRIIRIKGGKPHFLCATCHNHCERLGGETVKKKLGFLGFLQQTVRLKFSRRSEE
jgi:pSer/pThr/pTyr-binding forkhead associated (FHA) protein